MIFLKRSVPVLVVAFAALSARADTLTVVANGSIASHAGEGGNGFYMSTYADSSALQNFGSSQTGDFSGPIFLPEFTLPTGAVVTGATLDVTYDALVQENQGAATYAQGPEPVDQNHSFTPGVIDVSVSTATSLDQLLAHSFATGADCQLNNPGTSTDLLAAGFSACLSGTNQYILEMSSLTTLTPELVSAGYNSWEIFNFTGGNTVDVTANLTVDYTVTPEPSGIVLLATGVLGLMAAAWYRRTAIG